MDTINILIGFPNLFCAVLFIVLAIPLKNSKIKMNRLYGVRISKSFESEENWYKINGYGAQRMMIWAILLIAVGVISFFIPFNTNLFLISVFGIAPLIILIPVIEVFSYARKL